MTFDYAVGCAGAKGFEVLSTEEEFDQAYQDAISKGLTGSYVELLYKHTCGYVFKNTHYNLVTRGTTAISCPKCNQFKNQKLTHAMSEHVFRHDFVVELTLTRVFPEIKTSAQYNDIKKIMSVSLMHVDMFSELSLRDKNGKTIKLAIEYQGEQHEDSEKGFRAYLRLSRFKGVEGDVEWVRLRNEWKKMLLRDQFKVDLFASKSHEGFYLIKVPYTIEPKVRMAFLAKEFFELTGVRILGDFDNFDWKTFLL